MKMISLFCAAAVVLAPVVAEAKQTPPNATITGAMLRDDTIRAGAGIRASEITVDSVNDAVWKAREQCKVWLASNPTISLDPSVRGINSAPPAYLAYFAMSMISQRFAQHLSAATSCHRLLGNGNSNKKNAE